LETKEGLSTPLVSVLLLPPPLPSLLSAPREDDLRREVCGPFLSFPLYQVKVDYRFLLVEERTALLQGSSFSFLFSSFSQISEREESFIFFVKKIYPLLSLRGTL